MSTRVHRTAIMEVMCTQLLCGWSLGDRAGLLASSFVRLLGLLLQLWQ